MICPELFGQLIYGYNSRIHPVGQQPDSRAAKHARTLKKRPAAPPHHPAKIRKDAG